MAVIRPAENRRTETPAAVMTTLASPTVGGSTEVSVWRVHMAAGVSGPVHVFDVDQVWTVLSGDATFVLDGQDHAAQAGDTVVVPGAAVRQVRAQTPVEMLVSSRAGAVASVPGEAADRGTPPWIA